ncbi:methionyl-tRNA formyltransferase [Candidatus Omnitrophota bacterium]
MDIIFFGSSEFAVAPFKSLLASKHRILGVVTRQDKKSGRGQKMTISPIKSLAAEEGLSVWQPNDLRELKFLQSLKAAAPELFVVCSYGKILTKEVLQIPKRYAINLHASVLPKYRGAAPINWAIINGESLTGISIFKMNEFIDRGQIILEKKIKITPKDTSASLSKKLTDLGAAGLIETLELIELEKVKLKKQDQSKGSLAPKLKKKDGLINWQDTALEIHNRIRGLQPWPSAFTYFENKLLKIWWSEVRLSPGHVNSGQSSPGEIMAIDQTGMLVQTGQGQLLITSVQLEGKRKVPCSEFILGHKIEINQKLGK